MTDGGGLDPWLLQCPRRPSRGAEKKTHKVRGVEAYSMLLRLALSFPRRYIYIYVSEPGRGGVLPVEAGSWALDSNIKVQLPSFSEPLECRRRRYDNGDLHIDTCRHSRKFNESGCFSSVKRVWWFGQLASVWIPDRRSGGASCPLRPAAPLRVGREDRHHATAQRGT